MSSTVAMESPVSRSASGMLGVARSARPISVVASARMAVGSSRAAPPLATRTGSTTSGTPAPCRASVSATASTIGTLWSIPVLMQSAPISARTTRICSATKSAGTGWTLCTVRVSWAVSAVIAVAA